MTNCFGSEEAMSGSGEAPADNQQPCVENPDNINAVAEEVNHSEGDTEPPMLEDEEMPTFMSLTSLSRPDDSKVESEHHGYEPEACDQRPSQEASYESDNDCANSVYVVSSSDMDDEESDEMGMDDEEDEDEDDDDEDSRGDDEDSYGDIETEQFERSSDDFVLRYDSSRLERHHKARSRSLQDLTNSRSNLSRFVGKRRGTDFTPQDHQWASAGQHFVPTESDPLANHKKRPMRYDHVPSKVKMYIQSIKDQTRRSAELKNREKTAQRDVNELMVDNTQVTCTRVGPACSKLKYANAQQIARKETIVEEPSNTAEVTYDGRPLNENGTTTNLPVPELTKINFVESIVEIPPEISDSNRIAKVAKPNGVMAVDHKNHKIVDPFEPTCTINGEEEEVEDEEEVEEEEEEENDQVGAILNLRTVSYEEYANVPENKNNEPVTIDDKNADDVIEFMEVDKVSATTETEAARVPTSLKPPKSKSVAPVEAQGAQESSDFPRSANQQILDEKRLNAAKAPILAMLNEKTAQLNQKTAEFEGLRDTFQKVLTENIQQKRELEELRKMLAEYRAKNQPPETKEAAVQTVNVAVNVDEPKTSGDKDTKIPEPILLSSSICSALSSMEHWSDSNCSPAISINPPNMDSVLNSDDSTIPGEETKLPKNQPRRLSRSFITSSRIIETLANITQGRTKAASPLANLAKNIGSRIDVEQQQGQWKNNRNDSSQVYGDDASIGRAKKRKSDVLGSLTGWAGAFKKPRTPGDGKTKINSDSDTDGLFKTPREQADGTSLNADESGERLPENFMDSEATECPENVKCFVYHEEANSAERSFLIQAEEPVENKEVGGGGIVRECGPYLLGNVEIRMSEANGTINIWGKEVSQLSEDQDGEVVVDETNEFTQYKDLPPNSSRRASLESQSTTHSKFANGGSPFACSTNKKPRISPQYLHSGIGKYLRPEQSARVSALSKQAESDHYAKSPNPDNQRTSGCEHCPSHKKKRFDWQSCDHHCNPRRKQHSCCTHSGAEPVYEHIGNCHASHRNFNVPSACNASVKHSCQNFADGNCRRSGGDHIFSCRHSSEYEDDYQHTKKRRSSWGDDVPCCATRSTPGKVSCCDNRNRSSSYESSGPEDDHLLISNGPNCETPEMKRQRRSGKKVRGILADLLRGCSGGCGEPSGISIRQNNPTHLENSKPTVRIIPSTPPPIPSGSKLSTSWSSHSKHPSRDSDEKQASRSVNVCSRRQDDETVEIENKLEQLAIEMERLRSRSDNLSGMLHKLQADSD